MIAIFYTGLDRFSDQTRDNHNKVIAAIREIGPTKVYNFLQPTFDRSDCPVLGGVGSAGGLQCWDFMKAAQQLTETIIIKFRTDLWFTESSIEALINEIKSIINNEYDVSYLGANAAYNFENPLIKYHATTYKKIPDFVIVARRDAVLDIDRVRQHLKDAGDVANGNKVFKIITPTLARSYCVNCYIFLVRASTTELNDHDMGVAFYSDYPNGGAAAKHWRLQKPRPKEKVNHNIALIYIGAPRFETNGRKNHENLINKMRELAPVEIYDFTHNYANRGNCPWPEGGGIQVWDFMESTKRIKESIIVKFRTDLWFTPSAEDAVLKELSEIIDDRQDASFMGSNWTDYLGHEYTRIEHFACATLQDFVVMAKRDCLNSPDLVYRWLDSEGSSKRKCGTKVFKKVLRNSALAFNVFCQIYLLRKHYDEPVDAWQVGYDYISSYPKQWKMPKALPWYNSTKNE